MPTKKVTGKNIILDKSQLQRKSKRILGHLGPGQSNINISDGIMPCYRNNPGQSRRYSTFDHNCDAAVSQMQP